MNRYFLLGIVVEGPSDKLFFESHKRWFEEQGVALKIVQTRGRSAMIQEAEKHLKSLWLKGCQKVFFFLDQDADVCPPFTAERLKSVAGESDAVICVMARALEAWLLADEEAITRATGQPFKSQPTDALDRPKEILKGLFRRRHHGIAPPDRRMVATLCHHFSFERAAENNASLCRFLKNLKGESLCQKL